MYGNTEVPNSQRDLEKEGESGKYHTSWFESILQIYINQNSMLLAQKQTHNPTELKSPEVNLHMYGQLIYDTGVKKIQWGEDSLFNKWWWDNWTAICKRMIPNTIYINHIYKSYITYINQLGMDEILEYKKWNHEAPRRKHSV